MTKVRQRELILLRGLPGQGKSTFAKLLETPLGAYHIEGDQWRGVGEDRKYSNLYNDNAHLYCIGKTADKLRFTKSNVIVSNTFPTLRHLAPYFNLAHELNERPQRDYNIKVTVLHVQGPHGRSVHCEPGESTNSPESIQYYLDRWEEYTGEFDAAGYY